MGLKKAGAQVARTLRRAANALAEPVNLFPAVAVLALVVVMTTTWNVIRSEYAGARAAAGASSRELAETYEAQVVRALREIDQTLKFVKYAYELKHDHASALQELSAKRLLLPDLLFAVSVTDARGTIVASTRPTGLQSVADDADFQNERRHDVFSIGQPHRVGGTGDWKIRFARRLDDPSGGFAGVAMVTVDAAYFVSGYEPSKLGQAGMLALVGADGISRVRRSGDTIAAGDSSDFEAILSEAKNARDDAPPSPWDGVRRFTRAQQLYEYPLAIVVGLSEAEQLVGVNDQRRTYLWRAGSGSLAMLIVVALLWRMGRQLAQSRRNAAVDQAAHAARVEHLAYHDGLTELPNLGRFTDILRSSVLDASANAKTAVLFVDLDAFRPVNDSFGHAAGDTVLRQTAVRLQQLARDGDTVARVGGDGFVMLMKNVDGTADGVAMARRLILALQTPFEVVGHEVELSASVGIAIHPDHGQADELIAHADAAMYSAKRVGGSTFAVFDTDMESHVLAQLSLLAELRHALKFGQLSLYYQPKVDSRRGQIRGVEALLRWRHPQRGMIPPDVFIPIAERFGLIQELGNWVVEEACRQMQDWADVGVRMRVAINVSAHQLRKNDLVGHIERMLERHRIEASQLLCEITESVMMDDVESSKRVFEGLQRIGVYLSIDDFGTGYSSLSYLRQLPARQLKIDRSFVRDLEGSPSARAMVDGVIRLAHALELVVVAEGVETAGQRDVLLQLGCDELQGYFFARPMPADELLAWVIGKRPEVPVAFSPSVMDEGLAV